MKQTFTPSPNDRRIFALAGICAFLAMATNLFDVIFGYGGSEVFTYGTRSAQEMFDLFKLGPFKGVYALGLFNIIYMTFMVPVYFGMFAAHRPTHSVASAVALILALMALAIYVSCNAAIPMWVLYGKYSAATTDSQRVALLAAAEYALARGEDFTPGSFFGLIISGLAAITTSVIMLRAGVFGKINVWCGIIGFTFLSLFTFVATFIPMWYMFAYYFFGSIGGLLALTWFTLTGIRFIKLARVK
jgi:hypothetical protein